MELTEEEIEELHKRVMDVNSKLAGAMGALSKLQFKLYLMKEGREDFKIK